MLLCELNNFSEKHRKILMT